jgi:hypothetical protein
MLDNVVALITHLSDEELVCIRRVFRWTIFVSCLLTLVLTTYWVDSVTRLYDILTQTVSVRWGLVFVQGTFYTVAWSVMLCILSAFPYATNAVWGVVQTETHRRTTLAAGDPIRSSHDLPLMVRLTMASKSAMAMGAANVKRDPTIVTGGPFFS